MYKKHKKNLPKTREAKAILSISHKSNLLKAVEHLSSLIKKKSLKMKRSTA
jgi:hypothetical protein